MNKIRKIFDIKWFLFDIVKWGSYPFMWLYCRTKKLYENKKQKKSYKGRLIVCANHVSYDDVIAIIIGLWKRRLGFLTAKEVFEKWKKLQGILKGVGCIKVDRTNLDIDSIKKAISVIDRGHCMAIFPEGQINHTNELKSFKSGIVMTAFLAGADILPVYVGKRSSKFRREVMVVGERLELKNLIKSPYPTIDEIDCVTKLLNKKEQELKNIYEQKYCKKEAK